MKRLLLIVILILPINMQPQSLKLPPMKVGGDKMLHFAASYAISYHSYKWIEPRYGKDNAKIYSTLISVGIGVGKEIIDEKYRKGWEVGDVYANFGGIILFRYTINQK